MLSEEFLKICILIRPSGHSWAQILNSKCTVVVIGNPYWKSLDLRAGVLIKAGGDPAEYTAALISSTLSRRWHPIWLRADCPYMEKHIDTICTNCSCDHK